MSESYQIIGDVQFLAVGPAASTSVALDDISSKVPLDSRIYLLTSIATAAGAVSHIKFGDSTVTATTSNGIPLQGGIAPFPLRPSRSATHLACIATASTGIRIAPVISISF